MNAHTLFMIAVLSSILATSTQECLAQKLKKASFTEKAWEIIYAKKFTFEEFKGKESLYLENGKVRLKGSRFKNGIVDFDIYFEAGRKFLNFHFRVKDSINYEEFYLRPHQSGNPDAMQYTPVFNGTAAWQLYHGDGYSNAHNFNFNEWIHVRLVVVNAKMDVFINDMSQPVLMGSPLKMNPIFGMLGFSTARGGAHFANLSYQNLENPSLQSKPKIESKQQEGTVERWMTSNAFREGEIATITSIQDLKTKNQFQWSLMEAEPSGLVNLAQISPLTDKTNTILAKIIIYSSKSQLKRIDFGYSDVARVFVNNKIIYIGQRRFRSRDYRYLGTIGYFDAVYTVLKKGKNEIVFAITESFGGWGLKAKFENMEGISIKTE